MGARSLVILAALGLWGVGPVVTWALPDEPAQEQPKVENSRYQFEALINGSNVQVRSGPSENYYPTMKLDKGARIKVVGIKYEWLKIVPPEGSFSVVAKRLVDRASETAATGTINANTVNIRAGSSLNNIKLTVQCKLDAGAIVEIIGEDGDYYKIKPPADAYVYVNQRYADPVKQLAGNGAPEKPLPPEQVAGRNRPGADTGEPNAGPAHPKVDVAVAEKEDKAAKEALAAQVEFDRLESLAKSTWDKPLDEAPVAELIVGYETVLKSEYLPASQRAMGQARLQALEAKSKAKQELAESRKRQQLMNDELEAIRKQRETIEQRLRSAQRTYTAVGKLQTTTVRTGETPVYRLTDPATDRTLCYVKSADARYVDMVGKFIGVRGDLTTEPTLTLKSINATEAEEVDPTLVGKSISAQLSPPSLSGNGGQTASSDAAGDGR